MARSVSARLLRAPLAAAAATAVVALAVQVGVVADFVRALELETYDYRMAWYRGDRYAPGLAAADPVLVVIDEPSLDELGRFPDWPRRYHAELVERLVEAGARAIGLDILLPEPAGLPPSELRRILARLPAADRAAVRDALTADDDSLLAAALSAAPTAVLGVTVDGAGRVEGPAPVLARAASPGHVHLEPDPDGVLRRVYPWLGSGTDSVPALSVALAGAAGADPGESRARGRDGLLIDFPGTDAFLRFGYADVLRGRVEPGVFAGRRVLVGATAPGLMDLTTTPFAAGVPGVVAHAAATETLLNGRFIRRAGPLVTWTAAVILALVAAVAVAVFRPLPAIGFALLAPVAWLLITFELFARGGHWLEVVPPTAVWGTSLVAATSARYGRELRDRLAIRRAFSRYLAPEIVERVAARPDDLGLGGEERVVTVGFVDIRGFTSLAEGLEPRRLVTLLNAYLEAVTGVVLEHGGMVDKYIGDAVMMVFGAPNRLDDHAERACRAALAIQRVVRDQGQRWRALGGAELRIGVALNTGRVVVGNVGSARRLEYTVLGDAVNVAARLEGLNSTLRTGILVGPATRAAVGDALPFRALEPVAVRGRDGSVQPFELLDHPVPHPAGPP